MPQGTEDPSLPGELRYNSSSNKLELFDGSGRSSVVTESGSVTLTNKSIDATQNTIQNLTFSSFGPSDIPARRDLSNLQTTAINLALIPATNASLNLGSVTREWLNIYGQNILSINLSQMVVATSDLKAGFRFQGSTTALTTAYSPLSMDGFKITNLANPTNAQDAVTLNYLSTNYQLAGNYITALTGDVTASGPGSATASIADTVVTGKLLTGYSVGTNTPISATDTILQAFGKVQAQISGSASGITRSTQVVSTSQTLGAATSTDYVYLASGTITLTLPTAVGNNNKYTIKNTGTGTITVNTTSSQTIDGGLSALLSVQYVSIDVVSDGSNWFVV